MIPLEFRNVIQCERTRMMKKFDDMLSRYIIHSVRQMDGRAVAIVHAVILYGRPLNWHWIRLAAIRVINGLGHVTPSALLVALRYATSATVVWRGYP